MKKNRSEKEVSKLRGEIEVLKAQLKSSHLLFREEGPIKKGSLVSVVGDNSLKESLTIETNPFLKEDLSRALFLTFLSISFILLLKYSMPHQKELLGTLSNLPRSFTNLLPHKK